jgi:hypothetical protein
MARVFWLQQAAAKANETMRSRWCEAKHSSLPVLCLIWFHFATSMMAWKGSQGTQGVNRNAEAFDRPPPTPSGYTFPSTYKVMID